MMKGGHGQAAIKVHSTVEGSLVVQRPVANSSGNVVNIVTLLVSVPVHVVTRVASY